MNGFTEQCVERYIELANAMRSKLKAARPPSSLEERSRSDQDFDQPGELVAVASNILMDILYDASTFRFDLLQPVMSVAR